MTATIGMRGTLRQRLFAKVNRSESGCWLWTASVTRQGYGRLHDSGRARAAHRVSYELFVGPIPDGLQLDHLCRVRRCVNPDHLEPVTNEENSRRGVAAEVVRQRKAAQTHCKYGHPLSGHNLVGGKTTSRLCLACARRRARKGGRVFGPKRLIVEAFADGSLLLECGHSSRRTRTRQTQSHCRACEPVRASDGGA